MTRKPENEKSPEIMLQNVLLAQYCTTYGGWCCARRTYNVQYSTTSTAIRNHNRGASGREICVSVTDTK